MSRKVLVIGPGRKTRGGITSVIKAHENTPVWNEWNCIWIATYIDRNALLKAMFFLKGLILFLWYLPFARIVHIHFSEPTSAFRKNIFATLAKMFKKPLILHFHAFSPESTVYGKKKDLYKKIFNKADLIIVLSNFWLQHVSTLVNDVSKIKVLYNPCPLVERGGKPDAEKYVLFAGTLNKRKGYSDLIEAFSKIALQNKDWKLVFAGNGELDNAKKMCDELNIADQVILKGWVSGKNKTELFQHASIFCLPSYAEGFPMAVLDAWAYGLPVVTTPVGGLPDVLIHKNNAMIFTPGKIQELAENLSELMVDSTLREKLSKASLNLSREVFHINTISAQLGDYYKKLENKFYQKIQF